MSDLNYTWAMSEASRCLMCEDAPCWGGCPSCVNPKEFIRKIRWENFAGAVRALKKANVLAGSCAYICPSEKLCVGKCTSEKLDRPIDIIGLQRFVMDWERANGMVEPVKPRQDKARVAIVGAGPAGLSCAATLAVRGYKVTVYDAAKKAGGVLRYEIPSLRLPEDVLDYEIDFIKRLGVEFKLGTKINKLEDLSEFDAIFVSHGLGKPRKIGIPGEELPGVYSASDFLAMAKGHENPPTPPLSKGGKGGFGIGKRVLVIGGGSVAMDVVIEAKRLGAERVFGVCLEDYDEMPATPHDKEEAWKTGVEYLYRVMPLAILGRNKVVGFKGVNIRWRKPGRYVPSNAVRIKGTEFELNVDTVIVAIGQGPNDSFGLETLPGGFLKVDKETYMTSRKGVFAGGDAVRGPALAVEAVADGKKAAEEIDGYLLSLPFVRGGHGWGRDRPPPSPPYPPEADPPLAGEGGESVSFYPRPKADLSINFCGVRFENPFVLSAAPPTDDLEMVRSAFKAGWAGAVLKTTSVETEKVDLAYPMMTGLDFDGKKAVGFGNIDLISEHHIDEIEKRVAALKKEFPEKVVITSIMGSKKEEWQYLVGRLKAAGVDMIECSFSCPQGTLGSKPGAMLAQDMNLTRTVAGWVKEAAGKLPVVIKITPHVVDITEVAQAVKEAGCDAVCASNTMQSLMGIDLDTWVPNPNVGGRSTFSGMSGPAIKPLTLRCIAEIARKVGIPIAGTGGPTTWKDAVEFMLVGARTVQFCTAVMHYGYDIIGDLTEGLADYLERRGLKSVTELIGRALPFIVTHDELARQKNLRSRINKDLCITCGECVIACRDGGHIALKLNQDRIPETDDDKCVGCGLCRVVCPVKNCVELQEKEAV